MINKYDFTLSDPDTFKMFSVKDMLFLYWICPQVDKHLQLFNHYNEFVFTFSGKKNILTTFLGKLWFVSPTIQNKQAFELAKKMKIGHKIYPGFLQPLLKPINL